MLTSEIVQLAYKDFLAASKLADTPQKIEKWAPLYHVKPATLKAYAKQEETKIFLTSQGIDPTNIPHSKSIIAIRQLEKYSKELETAVARHVAEYTLSARDVEELVARLTNPKNSEADRWEILTQDQKNKKSQKSIGCDNNVRSKRTEETLCKQAILNLHNRFQKADHNTMTVMLSDPPMQKTINDLILCLNGVRKIAI